MSNAIFPIILAGGSGTRLWPLSRDLYPKQLLPLLGEHSLLQQTVLRFKDHSTVAMPLIICNQEHRFLVAEQVQQLSYNAQLLLEPVAKNTAPATALGALWALSQTKDAILLVLPADHVINETKEFQNALYHALTYARDGKLVTFGVPPIKPETGYGYIHKGKTLDEHGSCEVNAFVEKPDFITAQEYVTNGEYYWNSGMFMFRADQYLAELEQFAPTIFKGCQQAWKTVKEESDYLKLSNEAFAACPSDSIDYAIMEHTHNAIVVPLRGGWSDLGSWSSLSELGEPDEKGNVVYGDVIAEQTVNSYLRSSGRLVAAVGLTDHVVVETADAVLVAHKDKCQDVKSIVNQLKNLARGEFSTHKVVHRPWGTFETLIEGPGFKVKKIAVKPGASLSLQLHHQRAEHWVVVAGVAEVTVGDEQYILQTNQSTYIPMETKHRLVNPGSDLLEIIEVQTGTYLGEDDIVRFSDVYGR